MHCLRHWNRQNQLSARAFSHYTTVWYLATPSTMVCKGFTATSSLQNTLRQPLIGPRYDSASRCWKWCFRGHARFSLVRTGSAPFLCRRTNRHWVQIVWLCSRVDAGNIWRSWEWLFLMLLSLLSLLLISMFNWDYCDFLSLWRLLILLRWLTLLLLFSLVGINWFASCIRARPQEPDSVHTYSEHGRLPVREWPTGICRALKYPEIECI